MRRVPRYPQRILSSGNDFIDSAFAYYAAKYPRLCAHVTDIQPGNRWTLGVKDSPFRAVLFYGHPPATEFDATQLLGKLLYYLAYDLRHAPKTLLSSSDGGSASGVDP